MAQETPKQRTGSMTVEEAGRKGGQTTAESHGPEFYSQIGRKGGEAVSRNRQHMSEIGRKGGEMGGRSRAASRGAQNLNQPPSQDPNDLTYKNTG